MQVWNHMVHTMGGGGMRPILGPLERCSERCGRCKSVRGRLVLYSSKAALPVNL